MAMLVITRYYEYQRVDACFMYPGLQFIRIVRIVDPCWKFMFDCDDLISAVPLSKTSPANDGQVKDSSCFETMQCGCLILGGLMESSVNSEPRFVILNRNQYKSIMNRSSIMMIFIIYPMDIPSLSKICSSFHTPSVFHLFTIYLPYVYPIYKN